MTIWNLRPRVQILARRVSIAISNGVYSRRVRRRNSTSAKPEEEEVANHTEMSNEDKTSRVVERFLG